MRANRAKLAVAVLCRMVGLSRSGFYAWLNREESDRAVADEQLREKVVAIHTESYGTYGVPRIHAELQAEGVSVSRKRVHKLMRLSNIQGITRRRGFKTTVRDQENRPAPDLVERKFEASRRDELWVADITYVPTQVGFVYLAVVLDVWSRRIVGWSMKSHMRTELVEEALDMAFECRNPDSVIHHSDQGSQYTSLKFGERCEKMKTVRLSMGSVGDCYDNAMCESFFATLECELIARHSWKTRKEAELAVFSFIEGWYNTHRRHEATPFPWTVCYMQFNPQ